MTDNHEISTTVLSKISISGQLDTIWT